MALPPSGPQSAPQWRKQRTRAALQLHAQARRTAAQAELGEAKQRQTLVKSGALPGTAQAAEAQVHAAERRVQASTGRMVRPRPPVGHAPRLAAPPNAQARQRQHNQREAWQYRPGQPLPPHVQPPTPAMLRQTTPDRVVRLDDQGHAVIASHPVQARPAEVISVRAQRVRDLDALLQQGYQATHDQGIVTAWPAATHPSQRRLPDGRLDVDREQRRLERARIVQPAHRSRPPRGPLPRRQRGGRP